MPCESSPREQLNSSPVNGTCPGRASAAGSADYKSERDQFLAELSFGRAERRRRPGWPAIEISILHGRTFNYTASAPYSALIISSFREIQICQKLRAANDGKLKQSERVGFRLGGFASPERPGSARIDSPKRNKSRLIVCRPRGAAGSGRHLAQVGETERKLSPLCGDYFTAKTLLGGRLQLAPPILPAIAASTAAGAAQVALSVC